MKTRQFSKNGSKTSKRTKKNGPKRYLTHTLTHMNSPDRERTVLSAHSVSFLLWANFRVKAAPALRSDVFESFKTSW